MDILPLDLADAETIDACYRVRKAAAEADDPFGAPVSATVFRARLSAGWNGAPRETWFVPDGEDGTVAGWCQAEFPDLENLDRVGVELVVHPARRRGGVGVALLRHAAGRAVASGREFLDGGVQVGAAGEAFALRLGATLGQTDIRRVQDLAKIPAGTVSKLRETAASAAAGYSIVRWVGVTPDEWLEQFAMVHNALNDAPRDAAIEPSTWTVERVRDRMNPRIARSTRRRYSIAAVDDRTGVMAALTVVSVDPDMSGWGHQLVTAVTRPHRGHRLGLLVKTAMLDWLAETEPQLEHIETWNADSNEHMIAINESLGYTIRGRYRSAELRAAAIASI
jgi:GNAT superfamily N-acetyltransferase